MPDEKDGDQPTLEQLLAKWDDNKPGADNTKELLARIDALEKDNKSLKDQSETFTKRLEQDDYKEGIKPVISMMRGDIEVPAEKMEDFEAYAEWWINDQVLTKHNKKLEDAWQKRTEDPEGFDKVVEDLIPKFQDKARSVFNIKGKEEEKEDDKGADKGAQASLKDQLAAAIRASRDAPENETGMDDIDWKTLTPQQFAQKREDVFKAMRSGELKPIQKGS